MAAIIAYSMAGISTVAFITLWFTTSYRELSLKRQEVVSAKEQVEMHLSLYMQAQCSTNAQAAKRMLDTSRMIYGEIVKSYKNTLKKPLYRLPGFVMGFCLMSEIES